MPSIPVSSMSLVAFALPVFAQNEVLHYKFDEAGGSRVVNYASHTGTAPLEGTITTTDAAGAFVPGHFGAGALRGSLTGGTATYSYVDTGWNGSFTGDFTVAWFQMQRNVPPAANYMFGNPVGLGFRAFTGGAAGRGVRVTSAGTTPLNLDLTQDIQTLAQSRFVHLALVVDTGRAQATWWVDGVAATIIPLSAGPNVTAAVNFRVGSQLSGGTSTTYDLDEFRFLLRAATPIEVMAWAARTQPVDARFGAGCGGAGLDSANGPPALGNLAYAFQLSGGNGNELFLLSVGTSRTLLFGVPLPLNLGLIFPSLPGCNFESNLTLVFGGVTNALGTALVPLPIPPDPSLDGASLYNQGLMLQTGLEKSTNALATSLGQ